MLDALFGKRRPSPIRLTAVRAGPEVLHIPVAEIAGRAPGPTLLVTAGMDGDEYAGIEAAYELAAGHASGGFAGKLVVVPIMNVPGFAAESSQNPLDGKFPKYVFPHSQNEKPRTSTEHLMQWLNTSYVSDADAWYDMHAGAITEGLRPFLWLYRTGVRETDMAAQGLCAAAGAERVVFERAHPLSKAARLAHRGCAYAIAESGQRGSRERADVDRHLAWARAMMRVLGMIEGGPGPAAGPGIVLTSLMFERAPFDGIWRPAGAFGHINKGDVIGACCRMDGTGGHIIRASAGGEALWWKETMAMRKSDILCAIGRP